MAYAAVISLKNTLHHLVNSSEIQTLPRTSMEELSKELESLQEVLQRLDSNNCSNREKANAVDSKIRDAVYNLEDRLESDDHELVPQAVDSFTVAMKKMRGEYIEVLELKEDGIAVSVSSPDGNKSSKNGIFGLSDDNIRQLKYELTERKPYEMNVVCVFGMGGSGRSVMANYAFNHPSIVKQFGKRRAWVSVGPKYRKKEVLISLLFQVLDHDEGNYRLFSGLREGDYRLFSEGREEEDEEYLTRVLGKILKGKRYLVALDNVCDLAVWEELRRVMPEEFNGSRVLMTMRSRELVGGPSECINDCCEVKAVDEDESWDILVSLVFGQGSLCPPTLEKAGKTIARSCKGLLVEITKVARSLFKAQKKPEYWNEVAAERENCVFTDAYDELAEISRAIEDLELGNSFYNDDDDLYARTDFGRTIIERPELYNVIENLVRNLVVRVDPHLPRLPEFFSLTGMAGIGKTTVANKIFEDVSKMNYFDHHVWVTLSPKYESERTLEDILVQIDPSVKKMHMKEEEMLRKHFRAVLSGKKYLVVLDDIWNKEPLLCLRRLPSEIKLKVLLTTRLQNLIPQSDQVYQMRFLNKEQSWRLLCEKVFVDKSCPSELREPGLMIAENCEGLPLLIITVASLLSQSEKTPEFWNEVAKKDSALFEHANDEIKNVVFSSYEYLPQHLKGCFLYMGVFPRNFKIPSSRLFTLWGLEGILEPSFSGNLEDVAVKYLKELVSRSLVIVLKEISYIRIDTSTLHSVFWHLCTREAGKNKFFHVLRRPADGLAEHVRSQRRLCIQNNVLFSIKDVYNSMASVSTSRSLLCTGLPHHYPVPICFDSRLLKVLDALHIRLYHFPVKVADLVLLKYLSLTCDAQIPPSISKLRNLECLILRRHLSIVSCASPPYLPSQIWHMQKLEHLQVIGSELPDPCGLVLPNLHTLLDMSPYSCTTVLQGTPHVRKLGIRIELEPNASALLFSFATSFESISHLRKLKSLECIILNPELSFRSPTSLCYALPLHLKELSLSGLGYSWECIRPISCLPLLEVLKLQSYAFRGPEWVMHKGEFEKLRYLLLEDTDLVYWRAKECKIWHWHLILRFCYKLKEIPNLQFVTKVEVVDCNPAIHREIPPSWLVKNIASIHSSWK